MKNCFISAAIWLLLLFSNCSNASLFEKTGLFETGVVGELYVSKNISKTTAIVVLGGSSGQVNTVYPEMLANEGYVVLSLAYFRAPSLPETLDLIPIETVSMALDYLSNRRDLTVNKFGVLGISRGSELALLNATVEPRIEAVAVIVPSSVAWHGQTGQHAWTYQGQPLPALTFERRSEVPILQRVEQALDHEKAVKNASIAVENINAPILLISAKNDHIWPSEKMANRMVMRLESHQFKHPVKHIKVDDNHFLDDQTVTDLTPFLVKHFK